MSGEHKTKQDIRAAARRLFASDGYQAVSMRDIAQAVGKQQGGLYNHFASKQAILVDLMRENLARAHAAVIAPLDPADDPTKRLERFVRAHIKHNTAHRDDIFIAYMELRSLEPMNVRAIMDERDRYEAALRDILCDGVAAGQFTLRDPALHTRSLLAMLSGVIVWYRADGEQSLDEVAECYVQAALQSVGAPYAPATT